MGSQFLIGIKTNTCVVLAGDTRYFMHGIITASHDHDKSFRLGEKELMMCFGEGGDADQFGEYICKNLQLYKMRNGYELGPKATAHFIRKTIADTLRSQDAYHILLVLGGWDDSEGKPHLCSMDYLGSQFEAPYLLQGYGGRFGYALLDRIYKPDWTEAEAVAAVGKLIQEVEKRLMINLKEYQVQVIDKDGIRKLDNIRAC